MARAPTELTVLMDPRDPERTAARLQREGCLVEAADLARVTDLIASASSAALSQPHAQPAHDAADALAKARLLSTKGTIMLRQNHKARPWWKFWG